MANGARRTSGTKTNGNGNGNGSHPVDVGLGLHVPRLFTTPGTHPYDEVEWERRNAQIVSYAGKVSFEQEGVEVPSDWSLNATNIVAEKYFRGKLNTPSREWSVKQIIDRVVDSIVGWGEEQGRFATQADVETFSAELKHILVTQRACFNSPVWFNIGVPTRAQQASACQPYHSLVSTPEGLIPIGELVETDAVGQKVFDANGLTQVVAVKANGRKEVLRIHTKAGHTLDVTADHLVWRTGAGKPRGFVEAGTLEPGDQLHWYRTEAWGEGEIDGRDIAEAALAGWLQSDGFVGQYTGTNRSLTIEALTVNQDERDFVMAAIEYVFPDVHRHTRTFETKDPSLDGKRVRLYGNVLTDFVEKWGLRSRGLDMVVPQRLFTAPLPVVAAYLQAVFQAEGYVRVRERSAAIQLDMISEQLVRGVQQLLTRFGIFSRVRFKADRRPDRKGCWSLTIRTAPDRRRFADEIGFIAEDKAAKLEASFAIPGIAERDYKRLEIERIESIGEMDVYDIQTDSGEYLSSGGIRVHNCFILHVEDRMDSIADWYRDEMFIFKGGSGSGLNVSNLRSSYEQLGIGGYSSGPVSFMRGADAAAGTIKSGGATRRAAKMVVFNIDHPDIIELRDGSPGFIWCKAVEEKKARALKQAGFDMAVDSGVDAYSIQYQNANNSIRVTDEYMAAYLEGRDWQTRAVTTGDVINTYEARGVMKQISQAAWECADPGMQYHTTINDWHTAPAAGPITASNPCFAGDTLVHTDKGLIRIDELVQRAAHGETFGVYTHDATNEDAPAERVELTSPDAYMVTGTNEVWKIQLSNGTEFKCTPNHRFWTLDRGWVAAKDLTNQDRVKLLNVETPAIAADMRLPISTIKADYLGKGDRKSLDFELPEKWDEELAYYMGWLVGDGCISGDVITTVYAPEEKAVALERHMRLVTRLNGGRSPKPAHLANGTVQLRLSRRPLARFFRELGVSDKRSHEKVVPWSIFQAPRDIVVSFLRGLFDADGCVVEGRTNYIGFASSSFELSRGVQDLLSSFGVESRRYTYEKKPRAFRYTRKDGSEVTYDSRSLHDLRITGESFRTFAREIGFELPDKMLNALGVLGNHSLYASKGYAKVRSAKFHGIETTYNLSEPRNHSYVVNGVVTRNCSEYMHIDNSPCNLASINLLKFLREDGTFDTHAFEHTVSVVLLGQAILCVAADYPTDAIGRNARGFRQLGIGYANLGALLMALGAPYDSNEGRSWAAAITSLMQGAAYRASARFAEIVGPYPGTDELPGFAHPENRDATLRVLKKHAVFSKMIAQRPTAADRKLDKRVDVYRDEVVGGGDPLARDAELARVAARANEVWDETLELADRFGVENSQVSVLAPTGCLTGNTLVPTERGLVRLGTLGDPSGDKWQDLDIDVMTDEGPRRSTKFFVNGLSPVVEVKTQRGYAIKGTPEHRVKVVTETGEWVWKRFADIGVGDLVPLALEQLVGERQHVPLPPLPDAYWTSDHATFVPREMTADLAEFLGYFMGDGSLHARGIRLCVAKDDIDVVDHLSRLGKSLFGLEAHIAEKEGYTEVAFHSVRLVLWWEACGFAKRAPSERHSGKGYETHIPEAVLYSNDRNVYAAFLAGLFEADGTVTAGVPNWGTTCTQLSDDVRSVLLALGYPTTRKTDQTGWGGESVTLRLVNSSYCAKWAEEIGFIGSRKASRVTITQSKQAGRGDRIPITREMIDRLAPTNGRLRRVLLLEQGRHGAVSRTIANELLAETGDDELGKLMRFFYDSVVDASLGQEQMTFDLSVPDNVTYIANGFVSHNTIGFMMDCDTTGVEPDLALKKVKKMVGGGTMSIVNQTLPRALRRLGYNEEQLEAIVSYVDENNTVVGAPALRPEHYEVFACSFTTDNLISHMGHLRMMAAVQPFISGAISKTVNVPETATVEDMEEIFVEGWRLGLKAVAMYRDNCKADQPLSAETKTAEAVSTTAPAEAPRKRLPKKRPSMTYSFRVADTEGYVHVGLYPDSGQPGEMFIKVSKQGSTLAGVMDAFSIAVSMGLQHGVPLETFVEKFINHTFEPHGITDDPDVRFAKSLMDFIFRRIALDFLPKDKREALGIRSVQERTEALDAVDVAIERVAEGSVPSRSAEDLSSTADLVPALDAPLCSNCGTRMRPAGSCFACESCGSTSGCS